ncbi:DUF2116 family Zn-ribbon domain-containing protein [Pantoea sp. BAV 3049]|nr:DUF2116 family Zn-ribbon domain-containing protein [Pantoea sp. BAV 3049]
MEDKHCADCGMALSDDETWCCADCAEFYEMTDPNFEMAGGEDG